MRKGVKLLYFIEIDFDEASAAWKANKKYIGNGSYKYICESSRQSGVPCKREACTASPYCSLHQPNSKRVIRKLVNK